MNDPNYIPVHVKRATVLAAVGMEFLGAGAFPLKIPPEALKRHGYADAKNDPVFDPGGKCA